MSGWGGYSSFILPWNTTSLRHYRIVVNTWMAGRLQHSPQWVPPSGIHTLWNPLLHIYNGVYVIVTTILLTGRLLLLLALMRHVATLARNWGGPLANSQQGTEELSLTTVKELNSTNYHINEFRSSSPDEAHPWPKPWLQPYIKTPWSTGWKWVVPGLLIYSN
jgi:hypothetical protein